jgi:hypothetical protein
MMYRFRGFRLRLLIVGLYAVAMMSVGVMPTGAASARTGDLSGYVLPGQSNPVLCLTVEPSGSGTADTHHLCASCVLIGAAGTGVLPALDVVFSGRTTPVRYGRAVEQLALSADIWPVSRGPPATRA